MLTRLLSALAIGAAAVLASPVAHGHVEEKRWYPIAPKVMIISMFTPEDVWTTSLNLTQNVTLPGLSPLFPNLACNEAGEICHMTTGEAEINAACSVTAMVLASEFDLRQTYFLIAGIGGVNPYMGTTGSVGFARYAVQVALAYEIDSRQIPSNWSTGYFLFGSSEPGEAAGNLYGTEVYELNTNLRDAVRAFTDGVELKDGETAAAYRAKYDYAPANAPPAIFYGDVSTSDVYFAGNLLDEAFGNITALWTNGTGQYALTAQEDNATFEAMVRAHMAGKLDFSRVVLMRTASDFDRAPHAEDDAVTAFLAEQGGFTPATENIYVAGLPIVQGIIAGWESTFAPGIAPQDEWLYNANIFHDLVERKREVREFERMLKRQGAARLRR
ncbi:hypothetical protein L202_06831 [Cryptococcus amylolentus CBS 6039]|uniref:Purine nucleoside permease n=2 Tax=Cryptococcus amylolentus TaxID=104669 RepID=A0A1E3HDK6_9TREE|nr:hypothetical protein L202_06831 [Cryptococcus amylolentus CBS 6039]ODN74438.1 hypothetical protein L202_06831 [Cryptococcus amylolentus CBS 6039]ODO01437.1 hypothetical protein I350_06256 [Cryptococcus amylolentus CBS 6273]